MPATASESLPDDLGLYDRIQMTVIPHLEGDVPDPAPTPSGRLTSREVAQLLDNIQRFQAVRLAPPAPRPANPAATDITERHPTCIPAVALALDGDLRLLIMVVRAALCMYAEAQMTTDTDPLEPAHTSFFARLIAQIRQNVVFPTSSWCLSAAHSTTPEQAGQAKAMAQFLDRASLPRALKPILTQTQSNGPTIHQKPPMYSSIHRTRHHTPHQTETPLPSH